MKTKRHLPGMLALLFILSTQFVNAQDSRNQSTSPYPLNVKQKDHKALDAAIITFSEFPENTIITDQYANLGILFGPDLDAFIASDAANPTSPGLSGSPIFQGAIEGHFVEPGTGIPTTAESFMFDAGYFNVIGGTRLTWYDPNKNEIGHMDNTQEGFEVFNVTGGNIASWRIEPYFGGDGFEIDNVSFVLSGGGNNSGSLCLRDGFAYEWHLKYTTEGDVSAATGTVDVGGNMWNAWGWWNMDTKMIELHAINPAADNCYSGYTDSFVYVGKAMDGRFGYGYFGGQASWTSYCGGNPYGSGPISFISCRYNGLPPFFQDKSGITPAGAGNAVSIKVSPNPVNNIANIHYSLAKKGNVNITIYNYMMQPVKTLVTGAQAAGSYSLNWDGRNANGTQATPGLYKVVAVVNGQSYSTTMQVVR